MGSFIFNNTTGVLYLAALWAAIAVGAVLGRIIEHEPEVIETNPSLNKEQVKEWNQEFYRTSKIMAPSELEKLSENPYYLVESPLYRSNRRMSQFAAGFDSSSSSYQHYQSGGGGGSSSSSSSNGDGSSSSSNSNSRMNTRHYDITSVNLPYAGKRPMVKQENLEWMLQNIFMYPRSHVTNETAKDYVKKYISDSFQYTSGLYTVIQHFEPMQFLNIYENGQVPSGANIIGVIRGQEWGTPNDRPIAVGAHWDTVNFTPGTDDNGSGVSAMLETARAIAHSACKPKYTMIFVAFDLEEVGSQGSLIFIKEYLMKVLKSNFPKEVGMAKFQGAFIMDTIMDFNETEFSQTFPTDWSLVVPDVYDEVADERYKGDFLSMIYRREVDNHLAEKFHFHWGKSSHDQKFKLKPFPLMLTADLPELEILADHLNFLRSDHARFWYMNDTAVPHTLNAVLMTDTGPYRGNMRNCYHTVCDGPEVSLKANPDNIKFLTKITQVLTDTMMDMSECDLGGDSNKKYPGNFHSNTYLNTNDVHVRNSSPRRIDSPLKNIFNFVKWMQNYVKVN